MIVILYVWVMFYVQNIYNLCTQKLNGMNKNILKIFFQLFGDDKRIFYKLIIVTFSII